MLIYGFSQLHDKFSIRKQCGREMIRAIGIVCIRAKSPSLRVTYYINAIHCISIGIGTMKTAVFQKSMRKIEKNAIRQ